MLTGGFGNFVFTYLLMQWVVTFCGKHKKVRSLETLAIHKFTQLCIPVSGDHQSKLTLMSESLRNDGRIWVPKRKGRC